MTATSSKLVPSEPRILVLGAPSLARELDRLLTGEEFRLSAEPPEPATVRATDTIVLDLASGGPLALERLTFWRELPEDERPAILSIYVDPAHRPLALSVGDAIRAPYDPAELRDRVAGLARGRVSWRRTFVAKRKLDKARALLREAADRLATLEAHNQVPQSSDRQVPAYLAHEIRTPLNAILGFSEILKDQCFGPLGHARYPGYAADIHNAATHLARICENTLNLAKAEADCPPTTVEPVKVRDIFDRAVTMVHGLAVSSGVRLKVEIDPDFPELRADGSKLLQIVLNLTTNAIKFTPSGGRVKLKAMVDRARRAMILVIRDNGMGMSRDDVAVALTPFGQVGQPLRGRPQGAGLGLPLTRDMVERMGGQLEIVTRPGTGTIVTVLLPASLAKAA